MTESEIDERTGRGSSSGHVSAAARLDGSCSECGEQNPPGARFCAHCRGYLGWSAAASGGGGEHLDRMPASPPSPASHPSPASPPGPPAAPDPSEPAPSRDRFRLSTPSGTVDVPATGEPAVLSIGVTNLSTIVDGYQVRPMSAPNWLVVEAEQLRLLPQAEGTLTIRLRAVSAGLVIAQRLRVLLVVRSLSQAPAQIELPVEITVPAVDRPLRLRAEPSLLRLRDDAPGTFTVRADNPSNRTVRLRLSGSDPELAVRFGFMPEELQLGPGASGSVQVTARAPGPQDQAEISRQLLISAGDGRVSAEVPVTMQQSRGVSAMTTLAVRLEPSLIRVRDADGADVTVVLDNRRGREGLRVALEGRDPEQAMRLSFAPSAIDVPPGRQVPVRLRLDAWRPQPGHEVSRSFTVVASDGRTALETTGTLVQSSSRPAIETLGVRLEPSVLRLNRRGRGTLTAVVDNRGGAQSARVRLTGSDPEGVSRFAFTPVELDVPAGQVGRSTVAVRFPPPPTGHQRTLPFAVLASDGNSEASASGSVVVTGGARRSVARVIWTLLGGVAMIAGAFGTWLAEAQLTGTDLVPAMFGVHRGLGGLSAGHALAALGLVAVLGILGATGRVTRVAAMLGLLGMVAALLLCAAQFGADVPGPGAIVAALGCLAAYAGGRRARRGA